MILFFFCLTSNMLDGSAAVGDTLYTFHSSFFTFPLFFACESVSFLCITSMRLIRYGTGLRQTRHLLCRRAG
ncbi:hypothetical protein GGR56DRAFT_611603 [Xylariaceae sp. FL0804]|nr:hypothetical protein GGR56DRAFT_611603 [Xylariaceae sp. FL0804]